MTEAFFAVDLREEGVLLARGRFSFPKDDAFCSELAARAAAWFREGFFTYARRVYTEDADPRKRFFFPRFEYSVAICEKNSGILLSVTLVREGRMLACYEEALTLRDGMLCPPKRKVRGKIKI